MGVRSRWSKPGGTRRGPVGIAAAALVLALTAGCGAGPNSVDAASGSYKDAVSRTNKELTDVYRQIKGLDPAARKKKLIELAGREGGDITWYTAAADDDTTPLIKEFKKETGLTVKVYRASSATVLAKSLEEKKAGRVRGDILNYSGLDPTIGAHQGIYAPLHTIYADRMVKGTVHTNWIADQLYPFVVAWNTDKVKPSQVPSTLKDVLTRFGDGQLAFESTDSNWLFGVVQELKREGMTEKAAIDLVADAARKGVPVTGHTLISELLSSGQFSAAAMTYHYRSARQHQDGAPVAWEPQPQPVITTVSGTAISATTQRPAAALLFLEFQLTGEQKYWETAGRTTTNTDYSGGISQTKYHLDLIDDETLYKNLSKWDKLYADMMQSSGRPPRE
ncbi:ABC transporter substrate-binding protein [Streptomyces sp. NPDC050560]|uniref:ABC transporter substrate-binding protein n=1 Tax=Streptomyces sp. NPDC050560 TaxID=3365630 RepID=UPI0037B51858